MQEDIASAHAKVSEDLASAAGKLHADVKDAHAKVRGVADDLHERNVRAHMALCCFSLFTFGCTPLCDCSLQTLSLTLLLVVLL